MKGKPKILIDIDGVLADASEYFLKTISKLCNRKVTINEITKYRWSDLDLISEEEELAILDSFFAIEAAFVPAIKHSVGLVNWLYSHFEVWLVTARPDKATLATERWLNTYGLLYDHLVMGCPEKHDLDADFVYAIEDSYNNATQLAAKGIKTMLLDYPYNREPEVPNLLRVYDWDEIEYILWC